MENIDSNENSIQSDINAQDAESRLGCVVIGCMGLVLLGLAALIITVIMMGPEFKKTWEVFKYKVSTMTSDYSTDNDSVKEKNKHDIRIRNHIYIDKVEMQVASEDIAKGIRNHDAQLLMKHVTFNNKKITQEMANGFLDLVEATEHKAMIADNFEKIMEQNLASEYMIFNSDFKYKELSLMEIDEYQGGYNVSLAQAPAYIRSLNSETQELNFKLLNKHYNVKTEDRDIRISDFPVGIYQTDAQKIIDDTTFKGQLKFNPLESAEFIETFDLMKLSVYMRGDYDLDDERWLYVNGKKRRINDSSDNYNTIYKVTENTEVYATGKRDGKIITSNKVKIPKSLAHQNERIMISLSFK